MKKRIAATLIALLAAIAFSQPQTGGFGTGGNVSRNGPSFNSLAFFEFAPASGAGMGSSCACSAITGAKGEALTFTRTGSAMCSRQGLATTGITNSDLVTCAADQPRVELSGGVLGLRVEGARTNETLRSSEFDNAVWTSANAGVAAPTITANAATAPDGTLTADRVEIPATTSGQYSYRYQSGFSSTQRTTSVYIKGNGTSGTVNLLSGLTPNACIACPYVSDSWSRCELPSAATASTFFFFGNDSASVVCTTSSKGAQDVFVWGFQHELGLYATSYIPTVAASVTRNPDLAQFAYTGPGLTIGSMAATMTPVATGLYSTPVVVSTIAAVPSSGANQFTLYSNATSGATFTCYVGNSTPAVFPTGSAAFTAPSTGPHRGWCSVGTVVSGQMDTTAMADSVPWSGAFGAENYLTVGSSNNSITYVDTIVSQICRDPSPSRCR